MAKKRRILSKKLYSQQSLLREREYGFYWYAWLWSHSHPPGAHRPDQPAHLRRRAAERLDDGL